MSTQASAASPSQSFQGNDRLLFGIILGVVAFWMFAQTTLNIAPGMQETLGMNAEAMNIAVSITSLFSGIFYCRIWWFSRPFGSLESHPDRLYFKYYRFTSCCHYTSE